MAHTTRGYYSDRLGFEPEVEGRRQYTQQQTTQTKTQYLSSTTALATTSSSRYSSSVGNGNNAPYEETTASAYHERQHQRSLTSGSGGRSASGGGGGVGVGGDHHSGAMVPAPGTPGSQGMYEENLTKFKGKRKNSFGLYASSLKLKNRLAGATQSINNLLSAAH